MCCSRKGGVQDTNENCTCNLRPYGVWSNFANSRDVLKGAGIRDTFSQLLADSLKALFSNGSHGGMLGENVSGLDVKYLSFHSKKQMSEADQLGIYYL